MIGRTLAHYLLPPRRGPDAGGAVPRESGGVTINVVLGWIAEVEARLRRAS